MSRAWTAGSLTSRKDVREAEREFEQKKRQAYKNGWRAEPAPHGRACGNGCGRHAERSHKTIGGYYYACIDCAAAYDAVGGWPD